jgi:23S rRNA G2445 N2-methylase RlmL
LIEAAKSYPKLEKIVGFDNDKNRLSLSIQNIKKAGLIKKVEVKEGNIFDKPDFGKFDVIASDLPFGMAILKNEDLESLYKTFIEYCEEKLKPRGRLVVYTSEVELLQSIIEKSKLKVIKTLDLKFMTASGAYLRPKILVCEYRAK